MGNTLFVILAVGLGYMWGKSSGKKLRTIDKKNPPVELENIRRGVKNGWYTAVLTKVDGQHVIRLTGRVKDGSVYSDVYPVSEEDYYILLNDGLDEI